MSAVFLYVSMGVTSQVRWPCWVSPVLTLTPAEETSVLYVALAGASSRV